jgi:hypothetical protein
MSQFGKEIGFVVSFVFLSFTVILAIQMSMLKVPHSPQDQSAATASLASRPARLTSIDT